MPTKKTSIYLDPDLDFSFEQWAEREGVTKAEMIRRALRAAVEREGARPRPSIFGAFDGPEDLSERTDEHLGGGFGEE
jgi:metal-responsive CopG/Arc/MetJ family transcriptional regulator